MKKLLLALILLITLANADAQQVIPLYKGKIPGSKNPPADYKETAVVAPTTGLTSLSKVTDPTLTIFQPAKPNGTAVIICPGGGYSGLAFDKEGVLVAKRFNEIGITAFVLKYRLPSDLIMDDKSFGPLQDAMQAIYLVRKNANVWGINPNKIGIMGFSAGGHLAGSLSVHYGDIKVQNQENISLRPDFSILIYGVISFREFTHKGSLTRLLGENPTTEQRNYWSSELHVNAQTPITFMVHSNNDGTVPIKNSIMYNEALTKNKVSSELHIYPTGGHGFGLYNKTVQDDWFQRLQNWITTNKLN
ncbi:MAG: alpha/beta hydrolase [Pedobacter sp.]|nr:alpha/beta hydrolase [Pedobacter sp.]MDQ8053053.1 alpha/beta hydrolase [Pedobacter sp.]